MGDSAAGCYYRRLGDDGDATVFASTDATRSNWTPEIQHGSPPLALLTKAAEDLVAPGMRIGRLTLDILGAVPVADVAVRAWIERPGRRISLIAAEMSEPAGRPVARLTAWALAVSDTADVATDRYPALREGTPDPVPADWRQSGRYLETVEFRPQPGESAGASVFGVGAVLDPHRFTYMNTDTTLNLHRLPTGSDFALRARASIGADGIGVTNTEVFDARGFAGTCAQTLLVQRRPV